MARRTTTRLTLQVSFELPAGVNGAMAQLYVREAIQYHKKSLHQGHSMEPLLNLDIDTIRVSFLEKVTRYGR